MRQIEIMKNLRVRFPTRDAEFDDGVEIGMAMARMADSSPRIEVKLSHASLAQLRSLARRLSYRLSIEAIDGEAVTAVLEPSNRRPQLKLVASNG